MTTLHILNLGAGIQSTTLYLMSLKGEESEFVPRFDYAVFADTQEEPASVYRHLDWLRSLGGIPILADIAGRQEGAMKALAIQEAALERLYPAILAGSRGPG
jgi:hypothetical protein